MVCMCEFEDGQSVRTIRCLHMFHTECIDKWLMERTGTCPICKTKQMTPQVRVKGHEKQTKNLIKSVTRRTRREESEERELQNM